MPQLQTQYVERGTFVEQVAQLQRALTSCQLAADRREAAHKKIRLDLEREVAELKAAVAGKQVRADGCRAGPGQGGVSGKANRSERTDVGWRRVRAMSRGRSGIGDAWGAAVREAEVANMGNVLL